MTWLRPENVIWDTISSHLIGQELIKAQNILEVGIGNGYFTFMTLGGRFKKEYDWYFNVNTDDRTEDKDIYDHLNVYNIQHYIANGPGNRLKYAIDHKQNLLKQTEQLGFVDNLILQDANSRIDLRNVDTIYCNIIYWLNDPIQLLMNFQEIINDKGKIILVFPNSEFYKYCHSYGLKNNLQKLLNKGRAENIIWHKDLADFEKIIHEKTSLSIIRSQRYLCELTLSTWDIGLRPLSPQLIKMANNLVKAKRTEIKEEWCETLMPFLVDLMTIEIEKGAKEGGFNFVVLEK